MAEDYSELARRSAELLFESSEAAAAQALGLAERCVALDANRVDGYLVLTTALRRLGRLEDAVAWFKKGLELHPDNAELQSGLKAARVAVLDNLLDSDEDDGRDSEPESRQGGSLTLFQHGALQTTAPAFTEEDDDAPAMPSTPPRLEQSAQPSRSVSGRNSGSTTMTAFESKLQRIVEHLDLVKLAHLALFYIAQEMLALQRVSAGLSMLFVAILFQMAMHRHKLMVVSMLIVCFYRSELKDKSMKKIEQWARTSTDKLGAFTWMPRVIVAIPVFMKVFGHVKFMLFLHQDAVLTLVVTIVTGSLVANARRAEASAQATAWGEGRRLKFAAYSSAILYWAGYHGNYLDTLRLVAPALIDAAGIFLGSVTPEELQGVFQRAWKRLYADIAEDIQQDVEFDALFVLGLGNWVIEYWQQPTDFSVEMLARMLTDSFTTLEKVAVKTFRSELNHLRRQMTDLQGNNELALLVKYLKQSLQSIPPPQWLGIVGLIAQKCTSFVVCAILLVFGGVVSIPLIPFLVAESRDAIRIYELHRSGELDALDGLEIWLLGSPLVRVWENLKASIYCLEGTVTLSRAVATGTQIAATAARISRLATFASRVKHHGVAAHAESIPDHLVDVWTIAQDVGVIADGLRYIYQSSHIQDMQASVKSWWRRGKQN